jgi:glycerol dehydrogenase-like iron-containing ADH family enzyme
MGPEASWEEVERVLEAFKAKGGVHFVVGFGGGKVRAILCVYPVLCEGD